MKTERDIDPKHQEVRGLLRMVGPLLALTGLALTAVGAISLFSTMAGGQPRFFWCAFLGLPLLAIGLAITNFAFMGAVARYVAGESAPVAKDTFNYVADGTQEGVKTVARAVGEGLAGGLGSTAVKPVVRCSKCSTDNAADSKFCKHCGAGLAQTQTCPSCRERNDPDAQFCGHCGHALS